MDPELAIDGVEGTRWASNANQAAGMVAVLDLGRAEIFLRWSSSSLQQYPPEMPTTVNVYVSNDGTFPDEPVVSGATGGQTRTWIRSAARGWRATSSSRSRPPSPACGGASAKSPSTTDGGAP